MADHVVRAGFERTKEMRGRMNMNRPALDLQINRQKKMYLVVVLPVSTYLLVHLGVLVNNTSACTAKNRKARCQGLFSAR